MNESPTIGSYPIFLKWLIISLSICLPVHVVISAQILSPNGNMFGAPYEPKNELARILRGNCFLSFAAFSIFHFLISSFSLCFSSGSSHFSASLANFFAISPASAFNSLYFSRCVRMYSRSDVITPVMSIGVEMFHVRMIDG